MWCAPSITLLSSQCESIHICFQSWVLKLQLPNLHACNWTQVSALLVSGAHINIADSDGRTPLHHACEIGDPTLVDRLLHGAFNVLTYSKCLAHHHDVCTMLVDVVVGISVHQIWACVCVQGCRCFNQKPNLNKRCVLCSTIVF